MDSLLLQDTAHSYIREGIAGNVTVIYEYSLRVWNVSKYSGRAIISRSIIFMVETPSAENAKIILVKNLAPYSSPFIQFDCIVIVIKYT